MNLTIVIKQIEVTRFHFAIGNYIYNVLSHMWQIVTIIIHTNSSKNTIADKPIDNYASSVVSV